MINFSKFLFISLLVITVIFGLEQLSFENNVFADTRYPCCNNGGCDGLSCSKDASVNYFATTGKELCTDMYTINCHECIDLIAVGGQICPFGPLTGYCIDGDDCYGWCDGHWVLDK